MVEFDVERDTAFLDSLESLGHDVADATLKHLFEVAAGLEWKTFCASYGWREHIRQPVDTYPGAIEYFRFDVPMPKEIMDRKTHVTIFAFEYPGRIVLCAVAQ